MEGDVITMQDIFLFERTGIGPDGRVRGRFRATGIRPKCAERLAASGMHLAHGHVRTCQADRVRRERTIMIILALTFLADPWDHSRGRITAFVVRPDAAGRARCSPNRLGSPTRLRQDRSISRSRHSNSSNVRSINILLSRTRRFSAPLDRPVTQSGLKITVGERCCWPRDSWPVSATCWSRWLTVPHVSSGSPRPAVRDGCRYLVRSANACRNGSRNSRNSFPESIELMARALRAGHALTTGLQMVRGRNCRPGRHGVQAGIRSVRTSACRCRMR